MDDLLSVIGLIILFVLIVALAGFLNIWALNTLFPSLAIPYNIWTWLASFVLLSNFINFKKRKD